NCALKLSIYRRNLRKLLRFGEWGINLSLFNRLKRQFQQNFFWRLTLFNILGIAFVIILSSWAIYHTACFLAEGMGGLEGRRQQQFNTTLFHYLLIFTVSGIVVGSLLHIY